MKNLLQFLERAQSKNLTRSEILASLKAGRIKAYYRKDLVEESGDPKLKIYEIETQFTSKYGSDVEECCLLYFTDKKFEHFEFYCP